MLYSIFQTSVASAALAFIALVVGLLIIAGISLDQIAESSLTPALIVAILSALLAAALELVPGLSTRWFNLPKEVKRLSWLFGCLFLGITPWLLGCFGARLGLQPGFLWVARTCEPDTLAQGLGIATAAYFAGEASLAVTIATRKALKIAPYDTKDSGGPTT